MKSAIVDENQEFVFRFRIPQGHQKLERSLDEFYRAQLLDLARIVQFHFRGEPVDVDAFSFRNAPDRVIGLLPQREAEPGVRPARRKNQAARP